MVKNTYMICIGGIISKENDDIDNLMAYVCLSATENKEDLEIPTTEDNAGSNGESK